MTNQAPWSEPTLEGHAGPVYPSVPLRAEAAVRASLAERGRRDLRFLAQGILGYDKVTRDAHGALCRFVECPPTVDGRPIIRRIILLPRDHFKTTCCTIADTIRLIINDPNERILIVGSTAGIAQDIMSEIQGHFRENELFRWLYSEIVPDDFSKVVWNQEEMVVRRSVYYKEPTVFTIGSRGAVHSRHFTHIKADDIIGEKEYQSESEMDKTIRWSKGLEALLVTQWNDPIDVIGTRWKQGDVYAALEEFYANDAPPAQLGPFATVRGEIAIFHRHARLENGDPYFPTVINREYLDRVMREDPEQYAAWYANDPKSSGSNTFDADDLVYYKLGADETVIWREGDVEKDASRDELDVLMLVDPAVGEHKKACHTAIIVCGVLERSKSPLIFLLETRIGHYTPDKLVDSIFELDKQWSPRLVSVEKFGFQAALKYWMRERAERDRLPYPPVEMFPPKGAGTSQIAKDERIKGLQPLFRSHQILLLEGMSELIEEIIYHPRAKFRDGLDCLAQGLSYWPVSVDRSRFRRLREYEDKIIASIDVDGYSVKKGSPLDVEQLVDDDEEYFRWRGIEIRV